MKVLIDIGHPAHVHLFKHFAWQMQKKGHEILFTCREKEFEVYLLKKYDFKFQSFGEKYISISGKVWGMIKFDIKEFLVGLKFKPDVLLSHGSIYAAHAAFLLRKPHIALEDTGNMEQVKLYLPFSSIILTPESLSKNLGQKQLPYPGYHELAYLHPNNFIPDISVFDDLKIRSDEKYVILRFVSWQASHDFNQSGIDYKLKQSLISILEKNQYRIFISAEKEIPREFAKYKISISPEKMHDALAFSTLFIGEGATMANESALLGTPAVYINSRKACIGDLEKYNLLFYFKTFQGVLEKLNELMNTVDLKQEWQKRRNKMLSEKIDVTAFLVWFVEHYPESVRVMRERPEVQGRFR